MSTTYALNSSTTKNGTSTGATLGNAVSRVYAFIVAAMSSVMRPQAESPAEAAARLRTLAELYASTQPSYAADLRAAADHTAVG